MSTESFQKPSITVTASESGIFAPRAPPSRTTSSTKQQQQQQPQQQGGFQPVASMLSDTAGNLASPSLGSSVRSKTSPVGDVGAPTDGAVNEALLRELRKRVEEHEQQGRARISKAHHQATRQRDADLTSFFRDGSKVATLLSDEVGILLGKLKSVAMLSGMSMLTGLCEELSEAVERQMMTFYMGMQEKLMLAVNEARGSPTVVASHSSALQHTQSQPFSQSLNSPFDYPNSLLSGTSLRRPPDIGGKYIPNLPLEGTGPTTTTTGSGASPAASVAKDPKEGLGSSQQSHNNNAGQSSAPLKGKKLSVTESLSSTLCMFAESIAVLLRAEGVRVYLVDDKKTLELCTMFPFVRTTEGGKLQSSYPGGPPDPLAGNVTARGLARSLFTMVCEKGLAVSGTDSKQVVVEGVSSGAYEAVGQGSGTSKQSPQNAAHGKNAPPQHPHKIRNCLLWPIVCPSGHNRIRGMIHAVNKEGVTEESRRRFTSEDELLMFHASRMLGVLLERYPQHYFTQLDAGPIVHRLCHPHGIVAPHLPPVIVEEVQGAERVANDVLRTDTGILIYRGPMITIWKQALRSDHKKLEEYPSSKAATTTATSSSEPGAAVAVTGTLLDQAGYNAPPPQITAIEYNLEALNDLWKTGYDENVQIHAQCRTLQNKVKDLRSIVRNVLDAITVARGIKDSQELLMYLRSMELLIRSENSPLLVEHIHATMEQLIQQQQQQHSHSSSSSLMYQRPQQQQGGVVSSLVSFEASGSTPPQGLEGGSPSSPASLTSPGSFRRFASSVTDDINLESVEGGSRSRSHGNYVPARRKSVATSLNNNNNNSNHNANSSNSPSRLYSASSSLTANQFQATPEEIREVQRKRQTEYTRATAIAGMHMDGPSNVRGYTCDPEGKRQQVRAINELMHKHTNALLEGQQQQQQQVPGSRGGSGAHQHHHHLNHSTTASTSVLQRSGMTPSKPGSAMLPPKTPTSARSTGLRLLPPSADAPAPSLPPMRM